MSDRWDDLRFNATEGEWAARPLGDMRRCLADLLSERDTLAAEVERLRAAILAWRTERLSTGMRDWRQAERNLEDIAYRLDAALTEETTDE